MLFRGKKILVMGLGDNGGGIFSAKFCLAHGAEVLVTDLASEEKLSQSAAKLRDFVAETSAQQHLHFCLGGHKIEDFQRADLVIKNPGVPKDSPYLKAAKAWTSDLALFLELYPSVPVLAITGTKGKSSIAHALHSILQQFQPETMLGGNIGCSPLSYALESMGLGAEIPLRDCAHKDAATPMAALTAAMVLELSSWQLGDLRELETVFLPKMACISNIMRDHQNRYAKFSDYVKDKFYIFQNMLGGELFLSTKEAMFLGYSCWADFAARDFASGDLHYFAENLPAGLSRGIYWQTQSDGSLSCFMRQSANEVLLLNSAQFPLIGEHSFKNYCIASYMAYRFLSIPLADFCHKNNEYITKYRGVPFRMELRASGARLSGKKASGARLSGKKASGASTSEARPSGKIYFINDTTATMPDAAALALYSCLKVADHCLLIAGGTDKELNPSPLVEALQNEAVHLFLLVGNGTTALKSRLEQEGVTCGAEFTSLRAAFDAAIQKAQSLEGTICLLLSPGYASFGMFQNEFDRGRQFNQLVEKFVSSV